MLYVTPLYAGPLTLLYIWLSLRVALYRGRSGIGLGDGGDRRLLRMVRAQGNCAEYAPLGLVLLVMAEVQQASPFALHAAGLSLLAGRVMHAAALSGMRPANVLRVGGMVLTITALTLGAGLSLGAALGVR